MLQDVPLQHWTEADFDEEDVTVDEQFAFNALQDLWRQQADGLTFDTKSYVPASGEEVAAYLDVPFTGQEPTRFGVLQGKAGTWLSTKRVLSSAIMTALGQRRLELGITLMDLGNRTSHTSTATSFPT